MTKVIEDLFSYSRYCYNCGLYIWNEQYDISVLLDDKSLRPDESKVRNELVANKSDWQYQYSARVLQQAVGNLKRSWLNYWNPNMPDSRRPRFKSKKYSKCSFTTDRAKVLKGKLVLDKPREVDKKVWYGISMSEAPRFTGKLKLVTVTKDAYGYYASLTYDTKDSLDINPDKSVVGVDANIKHFNYGKGKSTVIYLDKLEMYYSRIKVYERILARKRLVHPTNFRSNNYNVTKAKLKRDYTKVSRIQKDILQKFTTGLVREYREIHIEDLDVHHMQMSSRMGKNLHRSLFGEFRRELEYKSKWCGNKLVIVPRMYPSTQLCSSCGFRKTSDGYGGKQTLSGDSIHHDHQTYYCYNCGAILDRDENAVENIKNYKVV